MEQAEFDLVQVTCSEKEKDVKDKNVKFDKIKKRKCSDTFNFNSQLKCEETLSLSEDGLAHNRKF